MIIATQVRAGMTILYNGMPHKVMSIKHITPGKGRASMQTKLRNLKTGLSCENRFRSDEKIERAILNTREMEYLYEGDGDYVFMDTESYDQMNLSKETLGDTTDYLVANVKFMVEFYEGAPVGVTAPKIVEMRITDTPPNIKGATASSSQKPATLETGLVVGVPPFVETGELIRVDSEEGKYVERAKE